MMETETISVRTGLSEETCKELLKSGWTYQEEEGQPSKWLSPLATMHDVITCPQCRVMIPVGQSCHCPMRTRGPSVENQTRKLLTKETDGR
jgi:rubredoxin